VISWLVDGLPEDGFTPRLVDSYWLMGAAIMFCQDEETKDWLDSQAPTMVAWEGSRLNVVGLDALPTYKRVVAWFLGPVEDTEQLLSWLCRLNRGLDTGNWRVYKCKEEPNGVRLVLSIDTASVTVLEGLRWRPFSGVGQAVFSFLGVKPEGKKQKQRRGGGEEEEEAKQVMVSTISFIQANLQHSITASSILTRMVGIKGIDLVLIQELWYHDGCVRGLNIPGYNLYSVRGKDRPRACIFGRDMDIWELPGFSCRDLVAVLGRYDEDGAERRLVVCSAYLLYDSEDPPPSTELEELVRYCENEKIQLLVGCNSNAHNTAWSSTNCNKRGGPYGISQFYHFGDLQQGQ
jgi:hypothetical protein